MDLESKIAEILQRVALPCEHPDFFLRVYSEVYAPPPRGVNPIEKIFQEDAALAMQIIDSPLQENVLIRNIIKTRKLAWHLISDPIGSLNRENIELAIKYLKERGYVLGPKQSNDPPYNQHILQMLLFLRDSKEAAHILRLIGRPFMNLPGENLIRETLALPHGHLISDNDAKRATIASLLCYFRQNVGSCFATAPAIIIQSEQPLRFLNDIKEILNTAQLKRTYGGIEYAVPMSPSWGSSTLKKMVFVRNRENEITNSDGFLIALKACGIIDETISYDQQKEAVHLLVQKAFPRFVSHLFSCEAFLKGVLLFVNGLKEEDLRGFFEKPRELIQQKLLFDAGIKVSQGSHKGDRIEAFRKQFEEAKIAFKAMTDNPLLRTWEFTLASFAESKADFVTWNLYSSLGLKPEEPDGIGSVAFQFLTKKMEENKKLAEELQSNYERTFLEVKALESHGKRVDSDTQTQWLRLQYTSKLNEMDIVLEKRDEAVNKINVLSKLFVTLIETYIAKFPLFFQEIYDADMQREVGLFFDDSPAGFRLLFKHGRSNPAAWTMIYTPDQFVDALVRFFTLTENEIKGRRDLKILEKEITGVVDEIIRHLRTKGFIESAFYRVAIAHGSNPVKNPLDHLEDIPKKPWVYTSGGSMSALVSCLYSRESAPTEVSRWVESELELLVFYCDCLRDMPSNLTRPYLTNPQRSMLAFSPTHAFILKPGSFPFVQSWNEEQYTYTWVRDHFFHPRRAFVQKQLLTSKMMEKIGDVLTKDLPEDFAHLIKKAIDALPSELTAGQFRLALINQLIPQPWVKRIGRLPLTLEEIDATLYKMLPLFSGGDLFDRVKNLLVHILGESFPIPAILKDFLQTQGHKYTYLSAEEFQNITKACILLVKGGVDFAEDIHGKVALASQALGYAMPRPIFIADTNWSNNYFGFVVNPATEELELWRLDYTGTTGRPIPDWKKWLDGTEKKKWGLYVRPYEYGQE